MKSLSILIRGLSGSVYMGWTEAKTVMKSLSVAALALTLGQVGVLAQKLRPGRAKALEELKLRINKKRKG